MKFGLLQTIQTFNVSDTEIYDVIERVALESESSGFDSFSLPDHVMQHSVLASINEPILDSWNTLSAIAVKTKTIRIGTLVSANTYRQPSRLAKIGATLDVISKGRLFLGIGAGNMEGEHQAYGIPFPSTPERIRRLEEAVQIIRKIWTEEIANFEGRYYTVRNAICNPKPIQKPTPPILIGGGGEKLTLRVVARHGDACNFSIALSPQLVERKLEALEQHCLAVGRNSHEVLKTKVAVAIIAEDESSLRKKVHMLKPKFLTDEEFRNQIVGTPEQCIEKVKQLIAIGLDYLMLVFPDAQELEGIRLFGKEVISAFQ